MCHYPWPLEHRWACSLLEGFKGFVKSVGCVQTPLVNVCGEARGEPRPNSSEVRRHHANIHQESSTHATAESNVERKTLLSTGSVMHQVVPHVRPRRSSAQATAEFSGTLTGSYSNVHVPSFANILSYATSGTLSGVGSTNLRGTLFIRGAGRAGWSASSSWATMAAR